MVKKLPKIRILRSMLQSCSLPGLLLITATPCAAEDGAIPVEWQAAGEVIMSSEGDLRVIEMSDQVAVTQGSMEIAGDHAVFEYAAENGRLVRATIDGAPVLYRQQLDGDQGAVTGTSSRLILFEDEETGQTMIEMIGDATIDSPDSNLSCASIVYNSTLNLIPSSTGPCGGSLTSPAN